MSNNKNRRKNRNYDPMFGIIGAMFAQAGLPIIPNMHWQSNQEMIDSYDALGLTPPTKKSNGKGIPKKRKKNAKNL